MSDNTTPDAEPSTPLDETTDAPYGTETALGNMTREHLRTASPIAIEIRKALEFHDSGTAVQAVRDVLGSIERAATEASRRRPRNRPPEFAELSPPALRQLAALCRVYALVDSIDLTPFVPQGAPDVAANLDALPDATLTVTMDNTNVTFTPNGHDVKFDAPTAEAVDAEVARIEAEVLAERAPADDTVIVNGMPMSRQMFEEHRADSVAINEAMAPLLAEAMDRLNVVPDPFVTPEQFDWPPEDVNYDPDPFVGPAPINPDAWFEGVPWQPIVDDPFATPAPVSLAELDRLAGGEPPF